MSKLGKIVLDGNCSNPFVIIAEEKNYPRALELVVTDDEYRSMKLTEDEITKIGYRGKKLNGRSVDLKSVHCIYNLKTREIGVLSEDAFCKLLRQFNNYQVAQGANYRGFLDVKQEIQNEIIKRYIKK